jgi:hypothetical protein
MITFVRARIAHGFQERGHVGDVVGVARRRVAGDAGFDVPSSGSSATRKLTHYHLSELRSNPKRLPLAEVAGYAERSQIRC